MPKYDEYRKSKVITQGTVLRNLNIEGDSVLLYSVVISQSCDIEQAKDDELPSIMVLPMYSDTAFLEGNHLYNNKGRKFDDNNKKGGGSKTKLLRSNQNFRYHYFSEICNLGGMVIDFKRYYTFRKNVVLSQAKDKYVTTINPLYREDLSQRFCNYLSRIGFENENKE